MGIGRITTPSLLLRGMVWEPIETAEWDRRAAKLAFASLQTNLGIIYDGGMGAPQDNVPVCIRYNLETPDGVEKWVEYWRLQPLYHKQ